MAKSTTKRHTKTLQGPQKSALRAAKKIRKDSGSTAKQVTKTDEILALLRQPAGATLKTLTDATGWQAHSVRGFISGHVVKKLGLRVSSFRRDDERVYAVKG